MAENKNLNLIVLWDNCICYKNETEFHIFKIVFKLK